MKNFLFVALLALFLVPMVQAVPTLQLYIDGATYDDVTETWVTNASSFDLYVIGTGNLNNVTLAMALEGTDQNDDPSGASVSIDGNSYPTGTWTYGYAPLSNDPVSWDGGNEDLPTHGIYPAWYTEFGLGNFTTQGGVDDVNEGNWLPTTGYTNSNHQGWFQSYHIDISGGYAVHFDAYTLDSQGRILQFAPFSHDAQGGGKEVPEPATMLLFGMGLAGAGIARRVRKTKK